MSTYLILLILFSAGAAALSCDQEGIKAGPTPGEFVICTETDGVLTETIYSCDEGGVYLEEIQDCVYSTDEEHLYLNFLTSNSSSNSSSSNSSSSNSTSSNSTSCSGTGIFCSSCNTSLLCLLYENSTYTEISINCSFTQTCVDGLGCVSELIDETCSTSSENITFECFTDGVFPDPYNCSVYHSCNGTTDTEYECDNGTYYNAVTEACDLDECLPDPPVPQCYREYTVGALVQRPDIYYACVYNETYPRTLIHQMYLCPSNLTFNPVLMSCREESQADHPL